MVLVVFFPGWSGKKPKQRLALLKKRLEEIPCVDVVIVEYLGISGPFTKLRTKNLLKSLLATQRKISLMQGEEELLLLGIHLEQLFFVF